MQRTVYAPRLLVVIVAVVVVAVALSACEHERAAVDSGFAPSFSTPSTSFQTSYAPRSGSVDRVRVDADLVVRPDRICIPVQIYANADENGLAMTLVEDASNKLKAAAGDGVTLRIDDIDARSDRTKTGARSTVSMRGVVETDLPEADAWVRAKKVSALHRVLVEQATLDDGVSSGRDVDDKGKPFAHVVVGTPEPGVKDIEVHRPWLLTAWSTRARALAQAAAPEGGALELTGCVPPQQVVVVGGTLEKVGLSLPVQCTFTVKKPGSP